MSDMNYEGVVKYLELPKAPDEITVYYGGVTYTLSSNKEIRQLQSTNNELLEALKEAEFIISVELGGVVTPRIEEAITNAKQQVSND